jgi:hypothetical protein
LEEYKGDGKFLFPVKALSKVLGLNIVGFTSERIIILESRNYGRNSGSFCQKAFGSPKSVVEYLKIHPKIAISNHRIQRVDDQM